MKDVVKYILENCVFSKLPPANSSYITPEGEFLVIDGDHNAFFNHIENAIGVCGEATALDLYLAGWIRCNALVGYISVPDDMHITDAQKAAIKELQTMYNLGEESICH